MVPPVHRMIGMRVISAVALVMRNLCLVKRKSEERSMRIAYDF